MSEIDAMPDWPILRHLTWREAHLFELGLWPGIGVALAVHGEHWLVAVALVSLIRRQMHDDDQRENADDLIRGYIRDGWYFGMGALLAYILTWAML